MLHELRTALLLSKVGWIIMVDCKMRCCVWFGLLLLMHYVLHCCCKDVGRSLWWMDGTYEMRCCMSYVLHCCCQDVAVYGLGYF